MSAVVSVSGGGGTSLYTASLGGALLTSNATSAEDIAGWSATGGGSYAVIPVSGPFTAGPTSDTAIAQDENGDNIWVENTGVAFGVSQPAGETHGGASYTWVFPLFTLDSNRRADFIDSFNVWYDFD